MRSAKFYSFIAVQVIILFLLVGQYYLIDSYGETFKVYIKTPYEYDFENYRSDIYVEYGITEITQGKWGIHDELTYNDQIYVLLETDNHGVYIVRDVADHKLDPYYDDQVALKAFYSYEYLGKYHVNYPLPAEINKSYFDGIDRNEPMIAYFKRAPWGQFKLIGIENVGK